MGADIGVEISVGGEKTFQTGIAAINSQIKLLGSEMKAAVAAFAGMDESEAAVTAKNDILERSISASTQKMNILQAQTERAGKKLANLAEELEAAKREFGENSTEAIKAQNAYNKQVVAVNRLDAQISNTRAEISRMEHEMKDTSKAAEEMGEEMQKAGEEIRDAGKEAGNAGNSFRDAFMGGTLSGAVQSFAREIASLVENTAEYRKIMGTLEVSGQRAGYSAEETAETYRQLYGVLGDTQQTATTAANLQALQLEQSKLQQITDGVIGAWATYGDSIPIDGLAEAVNETAKVGKVTGTFADVLNWAGTNEDAFNDKLEAAGSQAERVNLILEEMTEQGLLQAAEGWRQNNAEIVAANEATAELEQISGRLGGMLSPLITDLKEDLADALNTILDMLESGNPLIAMAAGLAVALSGIGLATAITQGGLFADTLGKMKTGFEALNAAMKANPILLVASLLAGLVTALITAYQTNEDFRNKVDALWLSLKTGVGEKIEAVKGYIAELKTKFLNFIERIKNIPSEMKTLGGNIISGLWDGIDAKIQWVKEKAQGAVDAIKNIFTGTQGFDTHSPSKWAKRLAKFVMEGLGEGFEEDDNAAAKAKEATEEVKEVFSDAADEIEKSAEEIGAAVERMEDKLSDYGKLFETISDENGNSLLRLTDMQESVDAIRAYGDALQELKGRGASEDLFKEILDMDVEAGSQYMDALLKMTDEDLSAYIALFEEKQKAAAEIAQAFYGIGAVAAENLTEGMEDAAVTDVVAATSKAVADAGVSTQEETMTQVLSGMQAQYPLLEEYIEATKEEIIALIEGYWRDFRSVGEDMMRGVAQGIRDGRSGVVNAVAAVIAAAVERAKDDLDIHSPSKVFAEIGGFMAQGLAEGWRERMRLASDTISRSLNSLSLPYMQPQAAVSGGNQTYSYGDINVYVDKLNNANGRDTQTLAAELEFYRRQTAAGRGGI